MGLRIIAVGKKHEPWVGPGISRYEARLRKPCDVSWRLLPHGPAAGEAGRREESKRIASHLSPSDQVILLDERGQCFTNRELAVAVDKGLQAQRPVVFVIGGAYGVDEALRARANLIWSLSRLTLPHQLVRLVLVEQLYRTQEILAGRPYHHD